MFIAVGCKRYREKIVNKSVCELMIKKITLSSISDGDKSNLESLAFIYMLRVVVQDNSRECV